MKHVTVLFGGISAEREVSISSGRQVVAALQGEGYQVQPFEVTQDLGALIRALDPKPDVVFNALHGRFGEDGVIQGEKPYKYDGPSINPYVRIPMKADTCSNPYRTPFRACRTVVGAKRRSEGVINGCPTGVKVLPLVSC